VTACAAAAGPEAGPSTGAAAWTTGASGVHCGHRAKRARHGNEILDLGARGDKVAHGEAPHCLARSTWPLRWRDSGTGERFGVAQRRGTQPSSERAKGHGEGRGGEETNGRVVGLGNI
jgi:hypothetical protein